MVFHWESMVMDTWPLCTLLLMPTWPWWQGASGFIHQHYSKFNTNNVSVSLGIYFWLWTICKGLEELQGFNVQRYGWGWNEMAGVRKGRESACPADKPQVALWKQGLSQELVDRMYCPDAGNDSSRHLPMPSWTVPSRASCWRTPQFPYIAQYSANWIPSFIYPICIAYLLCARKCFQSFEMHQWTK